MSRHADHRPATSNRYLNAVLTAIACLLLLNLLAGGGVLPRSASANAQEEPGYNKPSALPFNSGDQRNRMNEALFSIDERLAKIEMKLEKGLSVKVTEMPAVRLADDKVRDRDERRTDKPAPKVEVHGAPAPAASTPPAPSPAPAGDPK